MKILITGATGFIGKHLVNYLLKKGHKLVVIKLRGDNSILPEGVSEYSLNYDIIKKDIDFIKKERCDGVIHLASLFLANHKSSDIKNLIESNILFSTYLLECTVKAGIKWFLNTGTFWQNYENKDYSPVNLYAATKEAFMDIAQYYIETEQIRFSTLKLCDTYGPEDTRPKIINLFSKIAKSGEILEMSEGEQIIDISYIDDIIEAFFILSQQLQNDSIENGSVFAVKSIERVSLRKLAEIFEKATGVKLNINWGRRSYREREVMIPWENGVIIPDWEPKVTLHHGIKKVFGIDK